MVHPLRLFEHFLDRCMRLQVETGTNWTKPRLGLMLRCHSLRVRFIPMLEPNTVVDMFAGAGGLSLGFEQAGFVPVLGVDSDERALNAYGRNFPDSAVLAADARVLEGNDLLDAAGLSSYDVLIGGPPCAAFSVGGGYAAG